jgi:hypothetical protein
MKQLAKKIISKVPMSLRKSPPDSIIDIDQSTAQKNLLKQPKTELTTMLEAVQVHKNSVDQVALSEKEAVDLPQV